MTPKYIYVWKQTKQNDFTLTHFDDNIHWAAVGFPVGVNGHCPDLHHLPGEIVQFVCLNEGGVAFVVKLQLRRVVKNLDVAQITPDLQNVGVPGDGCVLMDLKVFSRESVYQVLPKPSGDESALNWGFCSVSRKVVHQPKGWWFSSCLAVDTCWSELYMIVSCIT